MKIQRYAEQEVEYYGGEIGYDYLPIGDVVEMDAAPNRRSREWCVVETPWEGDPRVISYHESRTAVLRAVERYRDQFSARNPGGYGYTWDIGRAKDAASAAAKALGSMTSPKKAVSSRANGAKGGAPKLEPYSLQWKIKRGAWVQDHTSTNTTGMPCKIWKLHYIQNGTEYSTGEFATKAAATREMKLRFPK